MSHCTNGANAQMREREYIRMQDTKRQSTGRGDADELVEGRRQLSREHQVPWEW